MQQAGSAGDAQDDSSHDGPEGTVDERLGWEDGESGGGGGREGGRNGGRQGRIRCGPPLTPALEVAVRLLADGYKCAVTLQVRSTVYHGIFVCVVLAVSGIVGGTPRNSHNRGMGVVYGKGRGGSFGVSDVIGCLGSFSRNALCKTLAVCYDSCGAQLALTEHSL